VVVSDYFADNKMQSGSCLGGKEATDFGNCGSCST